MTTSTINTQQVIDILNEILELELAGVVRYTHYSFMVFGYARIPIIKWMRDEAGEGLDHAGKAGEYITMLGGHPSLKIGRLLETHRHDITDILREALEHERVGISAYYKLLSLVRDVHIPLEEYAREMIQQEELHISEIEKMLRKPGELAPAR